MTSLVKPHDLRLACAAEGGLLSLLHESSGWCLPASFPWYTCTYLVAYVVCLELVYVGAQN